MSRRAFLIVCLCAALAPLGRGQIAVTPAATGFPGWPTHLAGRPLTPLALTAQETAWQDGFPGRVGRFSDGRQEIILRWVTQETRKLHASSDCFKANGYRIEPLPLKRDEQGLWSRFIARRGETRLEVAERIEATDGAQWSDVSAWYWAALLGRTQGPWWAVTVAARAEE